MRIIPMPVERADEVLDLYDTYDRPPDVRPSPARIAQIVAQLRVQGGEIYVAEIDGRLVGTYSIYVCQNLVRSGRPFAVIEHVICLPECRRQGIGRALMRHAVDHAERRHCYKVMLNTAEERPANHAFYAACGFKGDKRGFQVRFGV